MIVRKDLWEKSSQTTIGQSHGIIDQGMSLLWESRGPKDEKLFQQALKVLTKVIERSGEVTILTEGEHRYGNILFSICHEVIRDGKPGRPKKRLGKGVRVRLKNKGSKKGVGRRPRKKYQAPIKEHPETTHSMEDIPAVKLGLLETGRSWQQIFSIQYAL
jgi:hypothetical protein